MAMAQWVEDVLTDTRLSTDARVLALYVALKGGREWVEIARETYQDVLSADAGRDRVQRALAQLDRHKRIERRQGGRGHHRFYRILDDRKNQTTKDDSDADDDRDIQTTNSQTSVDNSDSAQNGQKLDDRENQTTKVSGTEYTAHKSLVDRNGRSTSGAVDGEDGGDITPLNPPPLSQDIEQVIETHGEKLKGCRGALCDYLVDRVPVKSRKGYVMSVVGWLDNGFDDVWRTADGSRLDPALRTARIAAALNALLSDERAQKMSGPVGSIRNLHTKLGILVRGRSYPASTGAQRSGYRKAGSGPPQQFDYSNPTEEFTGGFTP